MSDASTTMEGAYAEGLARSRADELRERVAREIPEETVTASSEVITPISGAGWYVVLILTLLGDALGALLDMTLILSIVTTLMGWLIQGIVWLYFFRHDVSFLAGQSGKKLATYVASLIIETIPFINALPMLSISFVVISLLENTERRHHNSAVWRGIRQGLEYAESHRLKL